MNFIAPEPNSVDYNAETPYPHIVIDGFLPLEIAERAYDSFPKVDNPMWGHGRHFLKEGVADKYEMPVYAEMPKPLQEVVDIINGQDFVSYLEKLTGFDNLVPDPALNGGGLNMVTNGGFLKTHADFNWSNDLQAYRTINVLLYLNKDWKEEWGGNLELWDSNLIAPQKSVLPLFNRAVIFSTFNTSYHGYKAVDAPVTRNSLNFYFYRKEAAPNIAKQPHKTIWK